MKTYENQPNWRRRFRESIQPTKLKCRGGFWLRILITSWATKLGSLVRYSCHTLSYKPSNSPYTCCFSPHAWHAASSFIYFLSQCLDLEWFGWVDGRCLNVCRLRLWPPSLMGVHVLTMEDGFRRWQKIAPCGMCNGEILHRESPQQVWFLFSTFWIARSPFRGFIDENCLAHCNAFSAIAMAGVKKNLLCLQHRLVYPRALQGPNFKTKKCMIIKILVVYGVGQPTRIWSGKFDINLSAAWNSQRIATSIAKAKHFSIFAG